MDNKLVKKELLRAGLVFLFAIAQTYLLYQAGVKYHLLFLQIIHTVIFMKCLNWVNSRK